jgi:hypothetical protein
MSTPMIAGLIALMLEKESLSHAQIKTKLESTAIDLGNEGKDTSYGSGLVNVSGLFASETVEINDTNATAVVNNASTFDFTDEITLCVLDNYLFDFQINTVLIYTPQNCTNCNATIEEDDSTFVTENCFENSLGDTGIGICIWDLEYTMDLDTESITALKEHCNHFQEQTNKSSEFIPEAEEETDSRANISDEEIQQIMQMQEERTEFVREHPNGTEQTAYSTEEFEFLKQHQTADKKRVIHKLMTTNTKVNIAQISNKAFRTASTDNNFGVLDYLFKIFVKDE